MDIGGTIGSIIGGAVTGGIGPALGQAMANAAEPAAKLANTLVERLVPDPAAKEAVRLAIEAKIAERDAVQINAAKEVALAQASINLAEAQGMDRYSARWRPTVGWICALGLAYNFLVAPFLTFVVNVINAFAGSAIPPAPTGNLEQLLALLIPLLGLAYMRTVERKAGTVGT